MLVSGVFESSNLSSLSITGVIFGLLSAVFWALYGVFSKIATDKGYSIFTTLFYSFLLISVFLLFMTDWPAFGDFLMLNPINNGLFALAHTLFTSILPYLLFTFSLKYIENGKASILCSGAEPLSASIFGLVIFSEVLTLFNIIGIVITIIAISFLTGDAE